MRTNIDIDDELMARVLAAGPFKTKKEAVEAGLRMLERQAAYREILKWRGKLNWGWGDEERLNGEPNWTQTEPQAQPEAPSVQEPRKACAAKSSRKTASPERKRHAGR